MRLLLRGGCSLPNESLVLVMGGVYNYVARNYASMGTQIDDRRTYMYLYRPINVGLR